MPVLPNTDLEQIQFCESHLPIWTAAPTTIGLTAGQCTALNTLTVNARKAYTDAQNARQASKAATTTFHNNTLLMRGNVADLIRIVKAFADASTNPGAIFAAAQIPVPAAPTPPPAPGMPTMVAVGLNPDGSITLRWKASNAAPSAGVTFDVSRRVGNVGGYTGTGSGTSVRGGKFEFTDSTLAFGTQTASYIIVGRRSNPPQMGTPSEAINVQFGVGSGGGLSIVNASGASYKMAA